MAGKGKIGDVHLTLGKDGGWRCHRGVDCIPIFRNDAMIEILLVMVYY
jgi:hypothetical protein